MITKVLWSYRTNYLPRKKYFRRKSGRSGMGVAVVSEKVAVVGEEGLGSDEGGGSDFGERDRGVCQAHTVHYAGGADEGVDVVGDVPDVHVHAGDHLAA